jgi:hypothetical protein
VPRELTLGQNDIGVQIRETTAEGVLAYIRDVIAYREQEDATIENKVACAKFLAGIWLGCAQIDMKAAKKTSVENHLHLTQIFGKTEEEIRVMSEEARKLYLDMRIAAATAAPR